MIEVVYNSRGMGHVRFPVKTLKEGLQSAQAVLAENPAVEGVHIWKRKGSLSTCLASWYQGYDAPEIFD